MLIAAVRSDLGSGLEKKSFLRGVQDPVSILPTKFFLGQFKRLRKSTTQSIISPEKQNIVLFFLSEGFTLWIYLFLKFLLLQ